MGSMSSRKVGKMAQRQIRSSDQALDSNTLGTDFTQMEQLLLPYEQLVQMGLVDPATQKGDYFSKHPGESRFGRALGGYEDSLAAGDETFARYRDTVRSGLEGIESGIPDDLRRSITEQLRSSQASRGILDSNVAGIEEVVRLMGGQEAVRSQRIGQAENYFGSVTQGAISHLLPDMNTLYGGELQRSIAKAQGRGNAYKNSGELFSNLAKLI